MDAATRQLLRDVLAVIDSTDPEHPTFSDSCADAVQDLCMLEDRLRAAVAAPSDDDSIGADPTALNEAALRSLDAFRAAAKNAKLEN